MHLADAIIATQHSNHKHTLHAHIHAFEADMFARARAMSRMTYEMMAAMLLDADAPAATIELYLIAGAEDMVPWFLMPVARAAIYAYYVLFRWWDRLVASLGSGKGEGKVRKAE